MRRIDAKDEGLRRHFIAVVSSLLVEEMRKAGWRFWLQTVGTVLMSVAADGVVSRNGLPIYAASPLCQILWFW